MDGKLITAPFEKIGARAKAFVVPRLDRDRLVRLDIRTDARGEFYECLVLPHVTLRAVDVRPDMRHLLLLAVDHSKDDEKHKFLCGHDERHWFVAGVPQAPGVSNVRTAMEALKPAGVRWLQERVGVKFHDRTRRRTDAYVRQGEWFFVKQTRYNRAWFEAREVLVRRNEPLSRGLGSKPHIAELAFRFGGEEVYVSRNHPQGLTRDQHREAIRHPANKALRWWTARRNPLVYVRGRITHPDHATVILDDWHQVLMNEEGKAPAMRHIAFVD